MSGMAVVAIAAAVVIVACLLIVVVSKSMRNNATSTVPVAARGNDRIIPDELPPDTPASYPAPAPEETTSDRGDAPSQSDTAARPPAQSEPSKSELTQRPSPSEPQSPSPSPPPKNVPQVPPKVSGSDAAGEMDVEQLIQRVEPSVVQIDVDTAESGSLGSGFVVDATGIIATNAHVMEGARSASITFSDGLRLPVTELLFFDRLRDIALLRVDLRLAPAAPVPLPLAANAPNKGAKVVAFGSPKGFSFSPSDGIVAAVRDANTIRRVIEQVSGVEFRLEGTWIQCTAPISSGNSGGPLLNMRGEVVGMNTMMMLDNAQNVNFAVSALELRSALDTSRFARPISFDELARNDRPPAGAAPPTLSENSVAVLAFVGEEPTAAMQDDLIKRLRSLDLNIAPSVTETAWVLVGFYDQEISPSARSPEVHIVLFRRHFTSGGRIEPQVKWEDSLTCSGNSVMKEYNTQMTNLLKRFSRTNRQFHE